MKRRNSIKRELDTIHERELQQKIHAYLISGEFRCKSLLGRDICILNPGKINHYEGPDFLNMALLINGELSVGNAEFHRRSSDWFAHGHHLDIRYSGILLHIVFDHDISCDISKETIILDQASIPMNAVYGKGNSLHSLDDLQDYALSRLLRKRDEIHVLSHTIDQPAALLRAYGMIFLHRRAALRRRHMHKWQDQEVVTVFIQSEAIQDSLHGKPIPSDISKIHSHARGGLTKHVYMELFVNCFAPLALLLEIGDQQAFKSWYWTQPSLSIYHSLYASFPDIPQSFMWQQQGVLEWKRHRLLGTHSITELLYPYHVGLIMED